MQINKENHMLSSKLPNYILYTMNGAIPHLLKPVSTNFISLLSLTQMYKLENVLSQIPLRQFINQDTQNNFFILSDIKEEATIQGTKNRDKITITPLKSKNIEITLKNYITFIQLARPDFFVSFLEDQPIAVGKKRSWRIINQGYENIKQMIEQVRTGSFQTEKNGQKIYMLCNIQGGQSLEVREKLITKYYYCFQEFQNQGFDISQIVGGFYIGGCDLMSEEGKLQLLRTQVVRQTLECLENIKQGTLMHQKEDFKHQKGKQNEETNQFEQNIDMEKLAKFINSQNYNFLKVVSGRGNPVEVLHAIKYGADICTSRYPLDLAEKFKISNYCSDFELFKKYLEENTIQKQNLEQESMFTEKIYLASKSINLKDSMYQHSEEKVQEGCSCEACQTSLAYLHHISTNEEMSAVQYLTIHNSYQYELLFENIRKAKSENLFQEYFYWFIQTQTEKIESK